MSKPHECPDCFKRFKTAQGRDQHQRDTHSVLTEDTRPDWTHNCEVCGQAPIVPVTGMCGPCTFGEADTVGGNW